MTPKKNSQLHAARPEVLRADPKRNIQEERGSWHLAGKVVQSYIQTLGKTDKQTNKRERNIVLNKIHDTSHARVF